LWAAVVREEIMGHAANGLKRENQGEKRKVCVTGEVNVRGKSGIKA
jgi:hypothetical protein